MTYLSNCHCSRPWGWYWHTIAAATMKKPQMSSFTPEVAGSVALQGCMCGWTVRLRGRQACTSNKHSASCMHIVADYMLLIITGA